MNWTIGPDHRTLVFFFWTIFWIIILDHFWTIFLDHFIAGGAHF